MTNSQLATALVAAIRALPAAPYQDTNTHEFADRCEGNGTSDHWAVAALANAYAVAADAAE